MADRLGGRDNRRNQGDDDILVPPSRRSTGSHRSYPLPPPHKRDSFNASGNIKANTGGGSFYDINNSKSTFIELSHRERLLGWLNIPNATAARDRNSDDFSNYLSKIEPGTGDWLLGQNSSYLGWSSSETTMPSVLWLYGDAGFGKSVLCAHAIRNARSRVEESDNGCKLVVAYQFYSWDGEPETPMTAFLNLAYTLATSYFGRLGRDKASEDMLRATDDALDLNSLQRLIRILVREFATLHLFIDGLDELVDAADRDKDKARWTHADTFLHFVLDLAVKPCPENDGGRVKVWITSQERHCIRKTVSSYATIGPATGIVHIPLHQRSNQSDIAVLFEKAHKEAMNSTKARTDLKKLQALVGSNFLWARWMLEDFAKPRIEEENLVDPTRVPQSFAEYLQRRIRERIKSNPESRLDAAHVLSCLVYAKRPLRVEELRDAVCASRVSNLGGDICTTEQYDPVIVKEICAPFVRVDCVTDKAGKAQTVCRLYHASVQGFLMKNRHVLQDMGKSSSNDANNREQHIMANKDDGLDEDEEVHDDDDDEDDEDDDKPGNYIISPRLLGRACLRYLQQARFKKPLKLMTAENKFDFVTADSKPGQEQSVNKQHFLAYAAKYWMRHLQQPDMHNYSARRRRLCIQIEQFVRSSQFHTLLQVQSIFVGGQFSLWHASKTNTHGFVRAFPSFFSESDAGAQLQMQYHEAISEWGYFLDNYSCHGNSLAGQIDLCLWGTLGRNHVLHPMRRMSRWSRNHKSYKIELKQDPARRPDTRLCFHDNLHRLKGGRTQLFSVRSSCAANSENVEVEVEVWTITPDLEPEMDANNRSLIRSVDVENLELYEGPLKTEFIGRPRAVAISPDGQVLRVGSSLYIRKEGSLQRLSVAEMEPGMQFLDEIGHREAFVVLTRRGNIARADLVDELDDPGYGADQEDAGTTAGDDDNSDGESVDSLNSTPRGSACGSDACGDDTDETEESPQFAAVPLTQEPESDFESAGNATSLCSARESYSEGSTTEQSDVIGPDDEFWSNWLSDDNPEIKDLSDGEDWASPPEVVHDHYGWDSDISADVSGKSESGDPIRDRLENLIIRHGWGPESDLCVEALAEYDGCPDDTTPEERVLKAILTAWFTWGRNQAEASKGGFGKDLSGNVMLGGEVLTEEVIMNQYGDDIEGDMRKIFEHEQEKSDGTGDSESDENGGKRGRGKKMTKEEDGEDFLEDFDGDWHYGGSSSESDDGLANTLRGGPRTRSRLISQTKTLKNDKPTRLCELVVLNTATESASNSHDASKVDVKSNEAHFDHPLKPIRIFRFAYKSKNLLFASPPAVHPTKPLVVWPIAGGELVFAHFSPAEKTFFTRNLGAGDHVCHLSIQVRFSPEGRHLHIACIDGIRFPVPGDNRKLVGDLIIGLLIRVSTYRLSRRKTARSPPRLIYQTSCPLQYLISTDPADGGVPFRPIPVSPLPWTLTWDWSSDDWGHVYACQSNKILRVVRLPLFSKVETSDRASLASSGNGTPGTHSSAKTTAVSEAAFTNKGQVFLPRSADNRRIHFIPFRSMGPPEDSGGEVGQTKFSTSPEAKKPAEKSRDPTSGRRIKTDGSKKTTGIKSTSKNAKGKKNEDDDDPEPPGAVVGTLVLSSEDATNEPSDGISIRPGREPPRTSGYSDRAQVVYLRERQFGGWVPFSSVVRDGEVLRPGEDDPTSGKAGRDGTKSKWMAHLKDKVEKFNARDDCDIVDFIR
ncbi:hypothetical protein CPLU01_13653 [Colletotrichum plurivorum]|uniref:Nephrocystin 3-like N-terminal domain-containing protein n=1 Tax=Colletotrichum plurivorum TaxID=2175906 RepID=A0A8H6JQW1_9PEZI|nr:hypothetical protein CPLU01_13653 [Colletotrichum plurivorum]